MGSPLGDFIRARRDATSPSAVGLPVGTRRRAPGLRRSELATLAGISVEYLTRIEQGRDRSPSMQVVMAVGAALRLDATERDHLRRLAKTDSGMCTQATPPAVPSVRDGVRAVLAQLEPGLAAVVNRLGYVLAFTSSFDLLAGPSGLLDAPTPNLNQFVFGDSRAREVFGDWERMADECAFNLWLAPSAGQVDGFLAELDAEASQELVRHLQGHRIPRTDPHLWHHPLGTLRLVHEVLELSPADNQQILVLVPADAASEELLDRMRRDASGVLRAVR